MATMFVTLCYKLVGCVCRVPRQQQKELELQAVGGDSAPDSAIVSADEQDVSQAAQPVGARMLGLAGTWLQSLCSSWQAYWQQPTLAAAFALALLYLTVLSLGLLMTAYIKAQGLTEAELAVERGFGALSGILATFTFPAMRSRIGGFPAFIHACCPPLDCKHPLKRPSRPPSGKRGVKPQAAFLFKNSAEICTLFDTAPLSALSGHAAIETSSQSYAAYQPSRLALVGHQAQHKQ